MTTVLPDTLPGHWVSVEGAEMARDYAGKTREQLMGGQFSDMEVAYRTALTHRSDNDFEARLGTAKDRIRWLSAQLALANATKADLLAALQGCIAYRNWQLAQGGVTPAELVDTWKRAEAAIAKAGAQ